MRKTAIVIPIYEPTEANLAFLKQFNEGDFDYFLIVDDGSGLAGEAILNEAYEKTQFYVFGYPDHKGKGFAIRFGIETLLMLDDEIDAIVVAGANGAQSYKEILKVRDASSSNKEALVLGARPNEDPSDKSKFGKIIVNAKNKIAAKRDIKDNRSGLMAIPANLFDLALATKGNRYQYETDFIAEASHCAEVVQVPIERRASESKSHFNPVIDNLLIHRNVILYVIASILSWVIDLGLFTFLSSYVFTTSAETQVYLSAIVARVASGFVNFLLLFLFVFDKREGFGMKMAKYGFLFLVNLGLSSSLTYAFKFIPAALTFIKFGVDAVISVANYFINKLWVFPRRKGKSQKSMAGQKSMQG
ncbi:MAG: hypothetical protein K6F32_00805 [Bacilli bacterium]|nr:hypothetical protein [Bacilli bacterium]